MTTQTGQIDQLILAAFNLRGEGEQLTRDLEEIRAKARLLVQTPASDGEWLYDLIATVYQDGLLGYPLNSVVGKATVQKAIQTLKTLMAQGELNAMVEGAKIAAHEINRELGLELSTDGKYYLERKKR